MLDGASSEAESGGLTQTIALPMVVSEYEPRPQPRDGGSVLRLALYAVGGLALVAAVAFLLGALVLTARRPS